MLNFLVLHSPVEQFKILPIIPAFFLLGINNVFILLLLFVFFFAVSFIILSKNFDFFKNTMSDLFILPNKFQTFFEFIIKGVISLTRENINSMKSQDFFPLISTLFLFLLCSNIFGLVPYSYTITSHLIVTFSLSLFLFIGINIICIRYHELNFFGLFIPKTTSTYLAFLLVPIEFISYNFKPISLLIRLFANMMAGHTLLKVIAGFSWTLVLLGNFIFVIVHLIPIVILVPLFALETAVAIIQSFVFTVLVCIYINDAINLH